MKSISLITLFIFATSICYAQAGFYDVIQGVGNGIRFWSPSTTNTIAMGVGSEYQYSFVTGYSIKTSMSSDGGYGWTWGVKGSSPIAALSNTGDMQIARNFFTGPFAANSVGPGVLSASGSAGMLSIANRSATSWVVTPTAGERWSIYSDGSPGALKFWSGSDKMAITSAGSLGIGTTTPVDQVEVVNSLRKVSINGTVGTLAMGGLISISRPTDGAKTLLMGTTPSNGTYVDNVIHGLGGSSELRLSSGGGLSTGFGFYINNDAPTIFAATRPTPVMKLDGLGNLGIGTGSAAPLSRLQVIGTGSTTVDMRVNGRMMTGDDANHGGVFLSSDMSMFIGQNTSTVLGLYNNGVRMVIGNNGSVGIGTITPTTTLDINGTGGSNVDFKINGRMVTGDVNNHGGLFVDGARTMFVGQFDSSTMGLFNNGSWRMLVDQSGNVGIGAIVGTTIDAKLAVKGQIHAQEVKVDLLGSAAPDYVFDKTYNLPSLDVVKSYIEKNHHLPEVPSAKEMEENGVKVGEMNMLLLKKVEELTLYVLELKKENEQQSKEIEELKKNSINK